MSVTDERLRFNGCIVYVSDRRPTEKELEEIRLLCPGIELSYVRKEEDDRRYLFIGADVAKPCETLGAWCEALTESELIREDVLEPILEMVADTYERVDMETAEARANRTFTALAGLTVPFSLGLSIYDYTVGSGNLGLRLLCLSVVLCLAVLGLGYRRRILSGIKKTWSRVTDGEE